MENKFYTPKIEEMSVGFECEQMQLRNRNSPSVYEEWNPTTIDGFDLSIALENSDDLSELFRVKHLDREDIESLGWIYGNGVFGNYCLNDKYFLSIGESKIAIGYEKGFQTWCEIHKSIAPPKNKFELKKLMEMLNIIKK